MFCVSVTHLLHPVAPWIRICYSGQNSKAVCSSLRIARQCPVISRIISRQDFIRRVSSFFVLGCTIPQLIDTLVLYDQAADPQDLVDQLLYIP